MGWKAKKWILFFFFETKWCDSTRKWSVLATEATIERGKKMGVKEKTYGGKVGWIMPKTFQ